MAEVPLPPPEAVGAAPTSGPEGVPSPKGLEPRDLVKPQSMPETFGQPGVRDTIGMMGPEQQRTGGFSQEKFARQLGEAEGVYDQIQGLFEKKPTNDTSALDRLYARDREVLAQISPEQQAALARGLREIMKNERGVTDSADLSVDDQRLAAKMWTWLTSKIAR